MLEIFSNSFYSQTPTVTLSDNRGLTIRILQYNRTSASDPVDELITQHRYTPSGQREYSLDPRLISALDSGELRVPNFRYHYSLSGSPLRTDAVDSGTVRQLSDIEGRPIFSLDAGGMEHHIIYEYNDKSLGRPLAYAQQRPGESPRVTDRFFYGTRSSKDTDANLNGQCVQHYDTAGLLTLNRLSLGGIPLQQQRQILRDISTNVHWHGKEDYRHPLLAPDVFITRATADALGQLLTQTDAKGHRRRIAYNRAGQLTGSWLALNGGTEQVIIQSVTYSAAGQKRQEEYGNRVVTQYRYEAATQRLIGVKTTRPEQVNRPKTLQDLRYNYDPVGNILAIHNDAEATRFYRNQKIIPETTYRYDALYQLIEATGRESDTNSAQSQLSPALAALTDKHQLVSYTRRYRYDRAGNLLKISHDGASQYSTNITVSDRSNHAILQQPGLTATDVFSQFDAAGNQQQLQPGQPLAWNTRNQLQHVTTVKRKVVVSTSPKMRQL